MPDTFLPTRDNTVNKPQVSKNFHCSGSRLTKTKKPVNVLCQVAVMKRNNAEDSDREDGRE